MTLTGSLADRDSWSAANCTMAATLDVVGRRASMLLLREAFYGAHRFDEFLEPGGGPITWPDNEAARTITSPTRVKSCSRRCSP